ncbi:hypothetical protein LDENG_00165320, partial [Lucifuga dentata]
SIRIKSCHVVVLCYCGDLNCRECVCGSSSKVTCISSKTHSITYCSIHANISAVTSHANTC